MTKVRQRFLLMLLSVTACAGCDQSTKFMARSYLEQTSQISLWADIVRLRLAENPGAFLGLGASLPRSVRTTVFLICVPVVLVVVGCYFVRSRHARNREVLAAGLIIGGGLGNLIDRVFNDGRVIDFLNVGVGPLRTGIFNVADMAVLFASVVLVLLMRQSALRAQRGYCEQRLDRAAAGPAEIDD